ncbi:EAL domain-containing protein [Chitinilyticum piscinae]|uniref:cyclic-guanylate-specific phosphodiesterase n=1 Tax=Chitinilyticum piscinae TaxID=2866724 RepID=A0A8J7FH04_9NEIS|nr:EAL domain-containing protein [Chitinilyticum piscinae]MBE9609273.1 EAL domain-containing protein [Chitinilyticum piscinae]
MNSRTFTRWLGRHAPLAGWLSGLLAALLVLLLGITGLVEYEKGLLQQRQQLASRHLGEVAQETEATLASLRLRYRGVCSPELQAALRSELLDKHYIRDAGLLDDEGRLGCLASAAGIGEALALPPSDIRFADRQSWFNFPVSAGGRRSALNMVSSGRHVVLLDSSIGDTLLQRAQVDAIWLDFKTTQAGNPQLVWAHPGLAQQRLDMPVYPEYRYSSEQHFWVRFDAAKAELIVGSNVPRTGYFIQNYLPLARMLQQNRLLVAALLALAGALGGLAGLLVWLRGQRYRGLAYRLEDLLQPEQVLCLYQPIVELASGRITGCEVLMRLRDGDSILFPDKVIPLILEQQLGWALDSAVSRKALQELASGLALVDVPRPFKVALNFFPDNIRAERLQGLLQPLRRDDLAINVEVTEYGMNADLFTDVARLRSEGYLISVDDFGTGYSNLGTVKRLAPDFLKIDRSFVHDMEDDALRASLIPEIVAIAHAVDAAIIAEGVENRQQADKLAALGVEYAQGYWFGKPMPLADFLTLLRKNGAA